MFVNKKVCKIKNYNHFVINKYYKQKLAYTFYAIVYKLLRILFSFFQDCKKKRHLSNVV